MAVGGAAVIPIGPTLRYSGAKMVGLAKAKPVWSIAYLMPLTYTKKKMTSFTSLANRYHSLQTQNKNT
jgi:hypothetical protein